MDLDTLYVCNSGNTPSAIETRHKPMLVKVGQDYYQITDWTINSLNQIVLLVKQV